MSLVPGFLASWHPASLIIEDQFSIEEIVKIVGKIFDIHPRFFYLARL